MSASAPLSEQLELIERKLKAIHEAAQRLSAQLPDGPFRNDLATINGNAAHAGEIAACARVRLAVIKDHIGG